ncbi:hypothetical protein EMPG_11271 [Blastomyces silverae]|uniref:Uncharacterized protein n=1 Tax=Blastomyces silverae TaxID=2060906 RepID=A0A0H1BS38_9EURO|nr:hypothetical protein EMPG_11271 [Blastomyces silverae]
MSIYTIDDDTLDHEISLLHKYKDHSESMKNITFLQYLQYYNHHHSTESHLQTHTSAYLKVIDDLTFSDFAGAYEFCRNTHNHSSDAYEDNISESESEVKDDSQSEESELLNS